MTEKTKTAAEWPTILVLVATYAVWTASLFVVSELSIAAAIALAALSVAQHASLTHEAIHGHPFRSERINAAVVWPAIGLVYPYARFRDTHLAHHQDCDLTDPYDDPESNYLAPTDWAAYGWLKKLILNFNNTLFGRLAIGPIVGTAAFAKADVLRARTDPRVGQAWRAHTYSIALVLGIVAIAPLPLWAYFAAVYLGNALIRIRTFLEHRAHEHARGRSVIIEDRGPLSLLFLNNNLHAVHHMHPNVAWYDLPGLYHRKRDHFLSANDGYLYPSYAAIFSQHFLRQKDPVPHPHYPAN